MPSLLNKKKAGKNLDIILDKMYSGTDIALLSEYRKLFKKEISFFKRSWAAAWLFMYYDRNNNQEDKTAASASAPESEITLSEEEAKRLFISIGKNRRLYPRELITYITSKTSAAREDIGNIRIMDNYSFIQVRDTKADEIIETLNGVMFRGRTLTVNYAKPKNEALDNA